MRMVNDTVFIFCKAKGQVPHSTLGSVPSGRMWGPIGEPTWRRALPQGLALGFNGLWLGSNLALSPGPSVMIPRKTPRWIRHSRWAGLGRECSEGRKVWGGWAGKLREARSPGIHTCCASIQIPVCTHSLAMWPQVSHLGRTDRDVQSQSRGQWSCKRFSQGSKAEDGKRNGNIQQGVHQHCESQRRELQFERESERGRVRMEAQVFLIPGNKPKLYNSHLFSFSMGIAQGRGNMREGHGFGSCRAVQWHNDYKEWSMHQDLNKWENVTLSSRVLGQEAFSSDPLWGQIQRGH